MSDSVPSRPGETPRDDPEPSGTFLASTFGHPQHGPESGWGGGGLVGRYRQIGNATWMMLGIGLVCFMVWVATGFVREDRAEYRRGQQSQIDGLERRVEHCEKRHADRDADAERERGRAHEDRQAAARERQTAADERKLVQDQLRQLIGILKTWTPPKVPPADGG